MILRETKSFMKKQVQDRFQCNKYYIKGRKILNNKKQNLESIIKNSLLQSKGIATNSLNLIQGLQDFIEKNVERSKEEVTVKQSSIWAKAITYSLIGGTVFSIGWLAIAQTEEIVITQGKLEPISGVIPIKIPLNGVTNTIYVKEGERVKEGQLLIDLDTEATQAKQSALIKSKRINTEILDKLRFLVKEGAVTEVQYLQQELTLANIEKEIVENELTLKYQKIKSPINGTVFNLIPKKPGYVINTNESILEIVPKGNLQARVEIESSKIGFVQVGKKVDISIDSFPATDFGVIEGVVTRVSTDALQPDPRIQKGFRYPSNIKLDTQYLETSSGQKLPLQAGMSLTANIKLRKVSYLQLLLGTFSSKADSLKEI